MHFNFACVAACIFAATALAVPVERKVVVVRAEVCPAPPPQTTASGPEVAPLPTEHYAPPPPSVTTPHPEETSKPAGQYLPPPLTVPTPEETTVPAGHYHPPQPTTTTVPAHAPAPPSPTTESNYPPPPQATSNNKQCSAGTSVHCCDTVDSTDNSNILNQLTAAGIDHNEATQKGQVGLTCTPITTSLIDALNGNVCQGAVTACCADTNQVGLVNLNLGCTIIPVNL
jgi:hypothetical protein